MLDPEVLDLDEISDPPAAEERPVPDPGAHRVRRVTGAEQAAACGVADAQGPPDPERRVEIGGGDSDPRGLGRQAALGRPNVGALAEQVSGDTHRDLTRRDRDGAGRGELSLKGRRVLADEHAEQVDRLFKTDPERRQRRLGGGVEAHRSSEVQVR